MNQQKAAVLPWLDLIRYVAALLVVMGTLGQICF